MTCFMRGREYLILFSPPIVFECHVDNCYLIEIAATLAFDF
jgi:hypothetical protein